MFKISGKKNCTKTNMAATKEKTVSAFNSWKREHHFTFIWS